MKSTIKKLICVISVFSLLSANVLASSKTWTTNVINGKYTTTATQLSSQRYDNVLESYATDRWTRAASYVVSKNKNSTLQFGGDATANITENIKINFRLNYSTGTGTSIGTTIPANSSRESRLAFLSDFNLKSFSIKEIFATTDPRVPVNLRTVTKNYSAKALEPIRASIKVVYYAPNYTTQSLLR